MRFVLLAACCFSTFLTGCVVPNGESVPPTKENKLTLGLAQMSIHKGASQSEVLSKLGSPNLVTRDKEGLETWVYEKTSYESVTSSSHAGGTLILLYAKGSESRQRTSQKTLTVIIKFKDSVVVEYSYNSSSF